MLDTIRELGVKIKLAVDKSGISQANKAVDDVASKVQSMGKAVATAAGGILGLSEAAALNARQLTQAANITGVNVERLQELGEAARVSSGVSREEMVGTLESLEGMIQAVRDGSPEAADAFKHLGIQGEVLKRISDDSLSADQAFGMVSEALSKMPATARRAMVANEVLGASGAKLMPMWEHGAKGVAKWTDSVRASGDVFSAKEIEKQNKFQQNVVRMGLKLEHMALVIGTKLMPIVTKVLGQFDKWITKNNKLITSGISGFIEGLGDTIGGVWEVVEKLGEGIKFVSDLVGGPKSFGKLLFEAFLAFKTVGVIAAIAELASTFISLGSALAGLAPLIATGYLLWHVVKDLYDLIFTDKKVEDTWWGKLGQAGYDAVKKVTGVDLTMGGAKQYDQDNPNENEEIFANAKANFEKMKKANSFAAGGMGAPAFAGAVAGGGTVINNFTTQVNGSNLNPTQLTNAVTEAHHDMAADARRTHVAQVRTGEK